MAANVQPAGRCSKCNGESMTCKYNHFEAGELSIDSWEHKCPDCGHRATTAFRSDDPDSIPAGANPCVCPYCGRQGDS